MRMREAVKTVERAMSAVEGRRRLRAAALDADIADMDSGWVPQATLALIAALEKVAHDLSVGAVTVERLLPAFGPSDDGWGLFTLSDHQQFLVHACRRPKRRRWRSSTRG